MITIMITRRGVERDILYRRQESAARVRASNMIRVGPLKLKAQFLCGQEGAIGPGKADLLDAIDREGSISAAGRALGMSYRRAWLLVDAMNRCWKERLVDTSSGGGRLRGARLTPLGREVLRGYRALEEHLTAEAMPQAATLTALMRDQPLAPTRTEVAPEL